jgi:hypothetical protein
MFVKLRGALLGAAFSLLMVMMGSVPTRTSAQQESADQVRIRDLEKEVSPLGIKVEEHEVRLVKVEDAVADFKNDWDEIKWWLRGLAAAIGMAVLERVLRTAGIKLPTKSDGLGPVG